MSIRATDYALDVLGTLDPGAMPRPARAVLLAVACRANSSCGVTIGGDWIARVAGLTPGAARRHIDTLDTLGVIAVKRRPGRAHLLRFPVAAFVHNPAHSCAGCNGWNARSPRAVLHTTPRSTAHDPAQYCATNRELIGCESADGHPDDERRLSRAERLAIIETNRFTA